MVTAAKRIIFIAASLFCPPLAQAQEANNESIRILTTGLQPYVHNDETGQLSGKATKVVREIMEEAGLFYTLNPVDWTIAYNRTITNKNTLIYPLDYNPERDDQFTWIAPIITVNYALYSLKDKYPETITLDDLIKSGATVGCGKNTAHCQILREAGFKPEQILEVEKLIIISKHRWLLRKRGDLTIMDPAVYNTLAQAWDHMDATQLDQLMTIAQKKSYLAASKKTPQAVVDQLRNAGQKLGLSDKNTSHK